MKCEICGGKKVKLIPDIQGSSIYFDEKTNEIIERSGYAMYRCPDCGAECKKTEKWWRNKRCAFPEVGE